MTRKSLYEKTFNRKAKFKVREYTRCKRCGPCVPASRAYHPAQAAARPAVNAPSSARATVDTMNKTLAPNTQGGAPLSMIQPNSIGPTVPPMLKERLADERPAVSHYAAALIAELGPAAEDCEALRQQLLDDEVRLGQVGAE